MFSSPALPLPSWIVTQVCVRPTGFYPGPGLQTWELGHMQAGTGPEMDSAPSKDCGSMRILLVACHFSWLPHLLVSWGGLG
mmetsp:Transcript_76097/g.134349  ORF Transcript_76097/g.134349 Transcript_76097/m.134349 type:complete len:81 (-) Transcript_76097:160-402(-)